MKPYLNFAPIIFFLACFSLSSGCATDNKSQWKTLREDAYHNKFSYDTNSVERTSANTVKVAADSNGAKFLYEIDCKRKMVRILEGQGSSPDWYNISGASGDQMLYDELCR